MKYLVLALLLVGCTRAENPENQLRSPIKGLERIDPQYYSTYLYYIELDDGTRCLSDSHGLSCVWVKS